MFALRGATTATGFKAGVEATGVTAFAMLAQSTAAALAVERRRAVAVDALGDVMHLRDAGAEVFIISFVWNRTTGANLQPISRSDLQSGSTRERMLSKPQDSCL